MSCSMLHIHNAHDSWEESAHSGSSGLACLGVDHVDTFRTTSTYLGAISTHSQRAWYHLQRHKKIRATIEASQQLLFNLVSSTHVALWKRGATQGKTILKGKVEANSCSYDCQK